MHCAGIRILQKKSFQRKQGLLARQSQECSHKPAVIKGAASRPYAHAYRASCRRTWAFCTYTRKTRRFRKRSCRRVFPGFASLFCLRKNFRTEIYGTFSAGWHKLPPFLVATIQGLRSGSCRNMEYGENYRIYCSKTCTKDGQWRHSFAKAVYYVNRTRMKFGSACS